MSEPFSPDRLAALFEPDPGRPHLLKRRESTMLELKENFHLSDDAKSDYGKAMCAFSNRHGGYILFGIKDSPHEMVGMTNDKLVTLDPNKLTQFLNNHFEPSIDWGHTIHTIGEKRFGIIYVAECRCKPVMCVRPFEKLREGEIYYRYPGESKVITSSDLQQIIQDRIEAERKSWRDLLARTARSNPSSTYLLDVSDGKAEGEGQSFVIGKDLLSKINFIHSGQFTEGGEPTLRVVGDVEVVRTETVAGQMEEVDPSIYYAPYSAPQIVKVAQNFGETHPHRQIDVIGKVNARIAPVTINAHDLLCVRQVYGIEKRDDFFYQTSVKGSPKQYSPAYVEWLVGEIEKDPDFIANARKKYKTAS